MEKKVYVSKCLAQHIYMDQNQEYHIQIHTPSCTKNNHKFHMSNEGWFNELFSQEQTICNVNSLAKETNFYETTLNIAIIL